jgi:Spy/CpxP family protein refolding chaperone
MARFCVVAALLLSAVPVYAQRRGAGAGVTSEDAPVPPAEIQRMFDAYALLQAQDQLKISDDQYSQFLSRFKALQDVRRKTTQDRLHLIQDMRQLLNDAQTDDSQLKDRLKAFQDLDARSAADIKKAYDAVDQVLDVKQQAKFRVFEELMERRKLELLTRARQVNRQNR